MQTIAGCRAVFRTMTLALMILIGGYGAVQAQGEMTPEEAAEEEATEGFLGLEWGAGIGVMGGFGGDDAVEKASVVGNDQLVRIDEEGGLRPQLFLEMHVFLCSNPFRLKNNKVRDWHKYQDEMVEYRGKLRRGEAAEGSRPPKVEAPRIGFGPFVAVQSSDEITIDALTVGAMWGFRRSAQGSNSVNLGLGLSFDPSVQVLGHGIAEGKKLPGGETAVRYKKESRLGWALMVSFNF